MIRTLNVYRCICSKCKHNWVTKTYEIPRNCAKCHRVTWNDDYDESRDNPPEVIPQSVGINLDAAIKPEMDKQEKLAALRGLIGGVSVPVAEPVDEWQGWTDERSTYDDVTGETITYRLHVKSGRKQEINRSSW